MEILSWGNTVSTSKIDLPYCQKCNFVLEEIRNLVRRKYNLNLFANPHFKSRFHWVGKHIATVRTMEQVKMMITMSLMMAILLTNSDKDALLTHISDQWGGKCYPGRLHWALWGLLRRHLHPGRISNSGKLLLEAKPWCLSSSSLNILVEYLMLRRLLSTVKPWNLSSCSLTWSPSSASSSPSSPTMASSTSSWRWNKHLTSALVSSQLLPDLRSDQICSDFSFSQVLSQVSTNLVLTGLLSSYINSTARNSRSPQGRRRIRGFQVEWFVFFLCNFN